MLVTLISLLTMNGFTQTVPESGIKSIKPHEMKAHVFFLASDSMRGRNTPSPELDSCASYIAHKFKSYRFKPIDGESYFQTFYVQRSHLSEPNVLSISSTRGEIQFKIKRDFVPLYLTANDKLEAAPVVFAGFGITAPEYQYDDYQDIDVSGKVVLVFSGEPQEKVSTSIFEGTENTEFAKPRIKVDIAMDHGAAGFLMVSNPLKPFRKPPNSWPSLMRNPIEDAVPLVLKEDDSDKIICMHIGKKLAENLMQGSGKTLKSLYQKINKTLEPQSFTLNGKTVSMQTTLKSEASPTHNVIGILEGADPVLKMEVVIIGAHYDHVGVVGGHVYNGADDNASGTAGLMEIAEAFIKCHEKPKRSVLFIAFSGEEKGLYGSRYYMKIPPFPIEKTVAMLNMDMISRCDTNEAVIIGSPVSSDLKTINEKVNENIGMDLAYDMDAYFRRSDHYTFYKKNIPVLFYSSDETEDLHMPTDDPEKCIPEKMARISKLVFSTAWVVANRDKRPNFAEFNSKRLQKVRNKKRGRKLASIQTNKTTNSKFK